MKRNKVLKIIGIGVIALAVVCAAFLGGKLLSKKGEGLNSLTFGDGDSSTVYSSMSVEPAPELPSTKAAIMGTLLELQDNKMIVQEFSVSISESGVAVASEDSLTSGPKKEVVVTKETKFYIDVTQYDPTSSAVTQQVVEPASIDDLTLKAFVSVWGRTVGDRIIAEVVQIQQF